jgi:hypothetical protein
MKKLSICLAIVGSLILWSCAVKDIDRAADLSPYKTFGWGKSKFKVENPAYKSDFIDSNIKASVKEEFARKGIIYQQKKPDLLVSYEGHTETKERGYSGSFSNYSYQYPYYAFRFYPYGVYRMGGHFWGGSEGYETYTQGTLIVNVRDRKTGKLVWRGVVQGNVDNVRALKRNITKGVRAIMKKYPAVPPPALPIPKDVVS